MTEGRVQALSHDLTPDLLRTKPDPDVEQRQNQFEQRAIQVILFPRLSTSLETLALLQKSFHSGAT